ncbi:uncharacterized protein [Eurosta solidaginis]|uniref:uncharacterized protein n=1 Tax=Eurosta solidaginis TaxID=178769 RepID=UPI003531221C
MSQEEVINSCRVCRSLNQDGDFACIYAVQVIEEGGVMQSHTWQLTEAGKLYEDTLGVEIDATTMEFYPQYLCNSCDLQMRLFRKLALRARRTLEELAKRYPKQEPSNKQIVCGDLTEEELDITNSVILDEEYLERSMPTEAETAHTTTQAQNVIDYGEDEYNFPTLTINAVTSTKSANEELYPARQSNVVLDKLQVNSTFMPYNAVSEHCNILTPSNDTKEITEATAGAELLAVEEETNGVLNELQVVALNSTSCKPYNSEDEKANMRTTPSEQIEFVSYFDEKGKEEQEPALKQEPIELFDELYLEDTNSSLPINELDRPKVAGACNGGRIRRAYDCQACGLEFLRRTDFLQHRKTVHSNKFPCAYCSKLLHTNDALRVHLRLHYGEPAYTCDICRRTFNQKVHYRYHMDRHNNVRNFKCAHCEKAFLSKHDLRVHTRTHTGDRPYECEICGKDFLILQHLKMHRYSHTNKSIECSECKQKFISPSTLRLHQQSIHNSDRRFQCEFCDKRFRRKHHLTSHYNVHTKTGPNTNSVNDLVEEEAEEPAYVHQIGTDEHHQQQLTMEEGDVEAFLEINEGDPIDGILVVDVENGNGEAIYSTDYAIDVSEESADMTF